MTKKNYAIKLKKISKKYTIKHQTPSMIMGMFDVFRGKSREEFWALKDVDLKIREGERIGVVGPNGAGKTTLLKILSGITFPTRGEVDTNGKIVSLINLEAGFHPDLTGEENIFLNGMLIGMKKSYIKDKFDEIVRFSGIENFIDAPFFTYSDGMKFRLAFSVAIVSNCDILVMDEVFVSGDVEFQDKTLKAIKEVQRKRDITTIVCSHVPSLVWSLSDTFYQLKRGEIKKLTKPEMEAKVEERNRKWQESMSK